MADLTTARGFPALSASQPAIRQISVSDLKMALYRGFDDFKAVPTHLLFLGAIYPVLAIIFVRAAAQDSVLPLVFPLLAGYTLIGPLVAIGMYELSKQREQGLHPTRRHAFHVLKSDSIGAIVGLGILTMVIYFVWLAAAQTIYQQIMGTVAPASFSAFASQIFGTGAGATLIVAGSGIGFLFAAMVFTLSVTSFPMLVDRNVGIPTAILTSVRVVMANKMTMGIWGLMVAALLVIGSIPLFVGLAIVLPVLGHATWHLYRIAVDD